MISEADVQAWVSVHEAASNGRAEVVRLILSENGVDINSVDYNGCTILQLAAWNGHTKLVKELLSRGARVDERLCQNLTMLQ